MSKPSSPTMKGYLNSKKDIYKSRIELIYAIRLKWFSGKKRNLYCGIIKNVERKWWGGINGFWSSIFKECKIKKIKKCYIISNKKIKRIIGFIVRFNR